MSQPAQLFTVPQPVERRFQWGDVVVLSGVVMLLYAGVSLAVFSPLALRRSDISIAPEVLPVAVPFLCVQPLVENAVRHGLAGSERTGHISINAQDRGPECVIEVEDDGIGEDPEKVRRALAGDAASDSVGLGNVDARLRNAYGDEFGLVVETAPQAGTKVTVRVPKFAPGVHT